MKYKEKKKSDQAYVTISTKAVIQIKLSIKYMEPHKPHEH